MLFKRNEILIRTKIMTKKIIQILLEALKPFKFVDKRETTPQWAEAAAKKQEVVKEQLDVLGKNKGIS